jgi:membrane protease YdiL (CAAX protease family)
MLVHREMTAEKRPLIGRIVALFEVVLCSDYPTQLAVGGTLFALGLRPVTAAGTLSLRYIGYLSLADTVLLLGLVVLFLLSHRERVRDVLLGSRPWLREAELGLPLTVGAFAVAIGVVALVRLVLPSLHNLEHNPLQDVIHGRRDALLFALVVVVAGGIREEIQRAFILHRFDVWLGGPAAGLIVSSVFFGLGHRLQGNDVAIATGMLGVYWGAIYLRRRSCIGPMVSHAAFNLIELLQFFVAR